MLNILFNKYLEKAPHARAVQINPLRVPSIRMKTIVVLCCLMFGCSSAVELSSAGAQVRMLTEQNNEQNCEVLRIITRSASTGGVQATSNVLRNAAADMGANAILVHPEARQVDSSGRVAMTADVMRCQFN